MSIEAMKQALEALRENHYYMLNAGLPNQSMLKQTYAAYEELRQAIATEESSATQEPKREWVGLTDNDELDWEEGGNLKDLVKAIEAKLKEKNT